MRSFSTTHCVYSIPRELGELVAPVTEEKSAPIVGAPDYVSAKLQGRNAAITVTAMNGYAQTG